MRCTDSFNSLIENLEAYCNANKHTCDYRICACQQLALYQASTNSIIASNYKNYQNIVSL